MRDLLYGLILRSGNDAAHDLALAAAGSMPRFVAQMNRRAAALGLADTHYANPVGLDQRGNFSSARDLATLSQRLLRIPAFAKIADSRSALLRSVDPPRRISTINELLLMAPWVTGVKTGHTFDAAYVLVGSGRRKGVEPDLGRARRPQRRSPLQRQPRTARIRLLAVPAAAPPIHAGQDLADPAIRYSGGELPLRAAATVAVGLRRGQRLSVDVDAPAEVEGPIARGARLGHARPSSSTGAAPPRCALRAGRAIPAASAFDRARAFAR